MNPLRPFGFMAENFQGNADTPSRPGEWPDAASFARWIDERVGQLRDSIWPEWVPGSGWHGGSVKSAVDLTTADLDAMRTLTDDFLRGKARARQGTGSNDDWFRDEDHLCARFDGSMQAWLHDALGPSSTNPLVRVAAFRLGADQRFSASIPWLLKSRLQRPRPHQAAYLLNRPAPRLQFAATAWSPSAISGHAYQGLMGCLNIYLSEPIDPTSQLADDLRILAADIGDRRVFAGVHYPSDNLMAWITALCAIPFMGGSEVPRMLDFAKEAIRASRVYQHLKKSACHAPVMKTLQPWGL